MEYLTEDKHFPLGTIDEYFAEPELDVVYPFTVCGNTIFLNSAQLAAAQPHLNQIKQEMLYFRWQLNIETLTGDREQEITIRFPAFLFDRGACSSPTSA